MRKRRIGVVAAAAAVVAMVGAPALAGGSADRDDVAPAVSPQIIGGRAAEPHSWMASLQYDAPEHGRDDWHTCGAVLIFRGWAVTNAHCVTDPPSPAAAALHGLDVNSLIPTADKDFSLRIGSADRTSGGIVADVVEIKVHPDWDWLEGAPRERAADLAMLKLDHLVEAQPIQLAGRKARPGQRVRLLGWGVTEPDGMGSLPVRLQQIDTTVARRHQCEEALITRAEICITNRYGTDGPCFGDSGGPAIAQFDGVWRLVGGTSRGVWCGTHPAVYTSTPEFRRWIYDTARGFPGPGHRRGRR